MNGVDDKRLLAADIGVDAATLVAVVVVVVLAKCSFATEDDGLIFMPLA